ncbi:hypothetical protein PAXRUDRAFT_157856 [Paxillus rubicundulus Ve08.2h10]|uniref:Unplaced genomic scaffold scaffold_1122, whole genome shotgun sequence n=1 Tax=Paxillus rubicundulus Ve08.2h10 TaxID=930991 RepID=A0A0D0DPC4_9AGAM|nr:hypothetical protein PAXRUDRAFT_157856 [Paxillus rubicundulus Ve08.2h10]
MSELIQAQGRGGRDGQPAKCIIIPGTNQAKIAIGRDEVDHKGRWFAHDYIHAHGLKQCLRYGLTLYINGTGTKCWDGTTNQLCTVCKANPNKAPSMFILDLHKSPSRMVGGDGILSLSTKRQLDDTAVMAESVFTSAANQSKKRRIKRQEGVMRDVEQMKRALNKIKDNGCAMCLSYRSFHGRHPLQSCHSLDMMQMSFKQYTEWKRGIRYGKGFKGICWKCHVPTCKDLLHPPLEKGMKCEWEDIVIPTVVGIFNNQELRISAQRRFSVRWVTLEELRSWLVVTPIEGHHSHAMDLMMWFIEVFPW